MGARVRLSYQIHFNYKLNKMNGWEKKNPKRKCHAIPHFIDHNFFFPPTCVRSAWMTEFTQQSCQSYQKSAKSFTAIQFIHKINRQHFLHYAFSQAHIKNSVGLRLRQCEIRKHGMNSSKDLSEGFFLHHQPTMPWINKCFVSKYSGGKKQEKWHKYCERVPNLFNAQREIVPEN